MTTPTAAEAAVHRAEEDAHVASELGAAGLAADGQERVSIEELRERVKGTGAELGGLVSSAEMMIVYNRYDGVSSQITTDQASQRLRVRFDRTHPWAGQLVWTTKAPENGPAVGSLLCPLHPESEERAYLDSLNFRGATCRKATLPTEYDRERHFEKHKRVHAAVEADKVKQMQDRQMELLQEQTAAMREMAAGQRNGGQAPQAGSSEEADASGGAKGKRAPRERTAPGEGSGASA